MEEDPHAEFLNSEVDKALTTLGEHFDACQFIGTFVDDEGMTHCLTRGVGNFYARTAACREFIERDQAQTTARAIGVALSEEDDEED